MLAGFDSIIFQDTKGLHDLACQLERSQEWQAEKLMALENMLSADSVDGEEDGDKITEDDTDVMEDTGLLVSVSNNP